MWFNWLNYKRFALEKYVALVKRKGSLTCAD